MQAVLDAQLALGLRPIETLAPADARRQPSAADAVKAVLRQQGKPTDPPPGVATTEITFTGPEGALPARVYKPADARGPLPVIVYYHGGGFVIADINVYDATPRALVRETGAIVVSVEYRRAPEFKFPAQQEDAFAAYQWVLANGETFGGDPRKIAVAGESAGGNLAANVAIMARDQNVQAPLHQLLIYPVAVSDMNTPSKQANANAKPLNRAMLMWFYHYTGRTPADADDPRLNLVSANLANLPPTTIVLADIDPLHDDGAMLADALRAAGSSVAVRSFPGVTHEFFGMDAVVTTAAEAQRFAGSRLRAGFGQ
jgi:acetyl esterase